MITYIRDILSVKNYNETNIVTTDLHLASISNNTVILDQVTLDCLAEEKNSISKRITFGPACNHICALSAK